MNMFKTRSILDRILLRIQDFRSNITFSLSIQRSLKECVDNLEPSFQDKDYLTMMKESILANSDLMALIMNNIEAINKATARVQAIYAEREKEEPDDSNFIFNGKFNENEEFNMAIPLSANKHESIDVFIKQENPYDLLPTNCIRSPLNMLPPYTQAERRIPFDRIQSQDFLLYPEAINKENLSLNFSSKKRGPYKRYSPSKKKQALDIFYSQISEDKEGMKSSTKKISKSLDIPCNTLKRWIKVGIYRRKGAGRKLMDPIMEERLFKWCTTEFSQGRRILGKEIRKMAKVFSTNKSNFKASKGWLVGFLRRFSLEDSIS